MFCLSLQFVVCSSIFACIIKCVDTVAAIEYFCVRWSSLKDKCLFFFFFFGYPPEADR